eukprot:CAMPEP_0182568344 /NCGR_PEP_ID=MMETSP1324-20130603/9318_1 /TAXON_ID=236786 /ORGANISM="Florenciella sp., Strain RCC1587" /LENGTH=145 /DNA_ID=CAMNT_0024782475 /DNA_START=119 /DNA_END=554 /DNA_ORIENTATION=+
MAAAAAAAAAKLMAAGERVNICDREVKPAWAPVQMSADRDTVPIPWHVKHQAFPPHTPTASSPAATTLGKSARCEAATSRTTGAATVAAPHVVLHPPPPPAGPTAIQSGTSPIKRKNGFPYAAAGATAVLRKLTFGSLIPAPEAR